ncbi:MAG: YHYH protein [Pseudomonadota bacterium]
MSAQNLSFSVPRNPTVAGRPTALSHRSYDAVMLNGVPVDILSAGCYDPSARRTDENGNTPAGCSDDNPWLIDPPSAGNFFGEDSFNGHTQPDGTYHYHANPMTLEPASASADGSPVIGFAADGFPIYGGYFRDTSGKVRKAQSGYELKSGARPKTPGSPGGTHTGMYLADWEFTGGGDLDECNGMTVNGQYGYYVTDSYPWILKCHKGTPDRSFAKGRP